MNRTALIQTGKNLAEKLLREYKRVNFDKTDDLVKALQVVNLSLKRAQDEKWASDDPRWDQVFKDQDIRLAQAAAKL